MKISVQAEPFDLNAEVSALYQANPKVGAVASFLGLVRDINEGQGVATLSLEHYPGMTEKALAQIVEDARRRWEVLDATLIHRVGTLHPSEPIVLVAVASSHRGDAFAACEFIMDFLKTRAPFWKKEATPEGERWVDARESDERAAARWQV
ncbi:MAG: molybdopterin synthase catalytic subunit MoaE [Hydrogenophilales bacterium CG17_big_fil_post_rev_8_21_14_2_50_63_12]|nr:MAG: molybdopterin synthase catalytic subunit MoaE [Hydrogenophilales bacterium CG17_big_fil_post_rev_8_21_14_2_50_63_12]PIX96141.1 MAG: molybdopterin synthase catalytic subunit MoaE [Hydrogenophilales bacterium CG_4_10_14_3_um_filter_63_21]PJB04598.1 MAG: molybdopterin synthase catalytic subunit MoaE [Hydrogenophilales bacterium CG_4_9_14_3_um_filter_63_34]